MTTEIFAIRKRLHSWFKLWTLRYLNIKLNMWNQNKIYIFFGNQCIYVFMKKVLALFKIETLNL